MFLGFKCWDLQNRRQFFAPLPENQLQELICMSPISRVPFLLVVRTASNTNLDSRYAVDISLSVVRRLDPQLGSSGAACHAAQTTVFIWSLVIRIIDFWPVELVLMALRSQLDPKNDQMTSVSWSKKRDWSGVVRPFVVGFLDKDINKGQSKNNRTRAWDRLLKIIGS